MSIEAVGSNINKSYSYEKKNNEVEKQSSVEDPNKINSEPSSIKDIEQTTENSNPRRFDQYTKGDAQKPVAAATTTTDTTMNTDAVDQEIEKLENEKLQLQSKLQSANEEDQESIQQQIKVLENEITVKSSDSYKKQNASVS